MFIPSNIPDNLSIMAVDAGEKQSRALYLSSGGSTSSPGYFLLPGQVMRRQVWHELCASANLAKPDVLACILRTDSSLECLFGEMTQKQEQSEGSDNKIKIPAEGKIRRGYADSGDCCSADLPATGLLCSWLFQRESSLLRLGQIPGNIIPAAIDRRLAFIPGLLALEEAAQRSFREGLCLLEMDTAQVRAALVFQGRLYAFLELQLVQCQKDLHVFLEMLAEFRRGWLPPEVAAGHGGQVYYSSQLPPDAEGFAPIYVTGINRCLLTEFAYAPLDDFTDAWLPCYALACSVGPAI